MRILNTTVFKFSNSQETISLAQIMEVKENAFPALRQIYQYV